MPDPLLYAAVCVLVPLVWGILVARAFDWLEERLEKHLARRRRARQQKDQRENWIEYYI